MYLTNYVWENVDCWIHNQVISLRRIWDQIVKISTDEEDDTLSNIYRYLIKVPFLENKDKLFYLEEDTRLTHGAYSVQWEFVTRRVHQQSF